MGSLLQGLPSNRIPLISDPIDRIKERSDGLISHGPCTITVTLYSRDGHSILPVYIDVSLDEII